MTTRNDGVVVAAVLASLDAKNLIQRVSPGDGASRWTMLETIRTFAREQLQEAGEAAATEIAHGEWFLAFAEQAETALTGPDQGVWYVRLETEHPNLRAALRNAISRDDAETALRVAGALWRFWYVRGHLGEGSIWLDQALGLPSSRSDTARAKARHGAGVLAQNRGTSPLLKRTTKKR